MIDGESRSSKKRRVQELDSIAERLLELPAARLRKAELPESVFEAVLEGQTMERTAFRRQRLYIARLLRELGEEVEPIREFVESAGVEGRKQTAESHWIESWTERLLNEGEAGITALLETRQQADRQQLRQLLRGARKEAEAGRPARLRRRLSRYLRELPKD